MLVTVFILLSLPQIHHTCLIGTRGEALRVNNKHMLWGLGEW